MPRCGQQLPERLDVVDVLRIDHRQPLAGRHLDQAQFRPVGMLRHKLGIEGNRRLLGQVATKIGQLSVGRDVIVVHAEGNLSSERPERAVETFIVAIETIFATGPATPGGLRRGPSSPGGHEVRANAHSKANFSWPPGPWNLRLVP